MGRPSGIAWTVSVLFVIVAGCVDFGWIDLTYQPNAGRKDTGEARLRRINSAEGWVEFFRDQIIAQREQLSRGRGFGTDDGLLFETSFVVGAPGPATPAAQTGPVVGGEFAADEGLSLASDGDGAGSFTSTNVQEIGVDESDVVKTDGEYIYMLVGTELRIIKAYPADEMAEVASVELDDSDYSSAYLYLNGDRVIAITQPPRFHLDGPMPMEDSLIRTDFHMGDMPAGDISERMSPLEVIHEFGLYYAYQKTAVAVIDVSDRGNPVIQAEWEFDGYYVDSRMVDGVLHLVVNQLPYIPYELDLAVITVEDIAKYIPTYDVFYADGSDDSGLLVMWDDFYHPVDPDGYNITTVISLDTNAGAAGWTRSAGARDFSSLAVMADPGTIYASTNALYLTDPDYDHFGDYRETLDIHKFALTNDGAEYVASGSVEGRLLNQFSLGEYQDHLRVATTTGQPWAWDERTSKNHIFVLAQNGDSLEVVGSIDDIAPGEQIYSARFVGERGFLVTFRRIDPLFTIDLSNPRNPRVAGKLKVPGFSEYIHPLDDDHLLTLGRAATEEGVTLGLQLSIFDVSDFGNPRLVVSEEIGGVGTYSEAEHNHKAFVYYPQENLLAIPVVLYNDGWDYEFSGLQIYHVTPEEGITLRGQISTESDPEQGYPTYWGWSRGMFIEDLIYALTEVGVQAALTTSPGDVIKSIEIEGSPHTSGGGLIEPAIEPPVTDF